MIVATILFFAMNIVPCLVKAPVEPEDDEDEKTKGPTKDTGKVETLKRKIPPKDFDQESIITVASERISLNAYGPSSKMSQWNFSNDNKGRKTLKDLADPSIISSQVGNKLMF